MNAELHKGDLSGGVSFGDSVAVDTETMGLNPLRDRLCLVQLSDSQGNCHIVQFIRSSSHESNYTAPNLKALLGNQNVVKLFHFARFDVATIAHHLGVWCEPIYCTKIASKIARTNSDSHGLKDLCKNLLSVELSKRMQLSDWGNDILTEEQIAYAADDVLYLHRLREKLDYLLLREGRVGLARSCMDFIPTRARLDLEGWQGIDILGH